MKISLSAPSVIAAWLAGITAFTTQIDTAFLPFLDRQNTTAEPQFHDDYANLVGLRVRDYSDQERSTGVTAFDEPEAEREPARSTVVQHPEPPAPVSAPSFRRTVQVGRGDTLIGLLTKASVPANEAHETVSALRRLYNPRSLQVGQDITLLFDGPSRQARLIGLEIEPDAERTVTVERVDEAAFQATQVEKVLRQQTLGAQAVIRSSLSAAGASAGVPMSVMISAIRAFSYSVDFQRDIQPGDNFEILYERVVNEDGVVARDGDILFAGLTLSGKPIELFRFEFPDGTTEYYQPDGTSMKKALLRTPVDGARITSTFGMRTHPILGYTKMHKGMDFGAPTGTPVYAAGDGSIDEIGAWGAYGNYIRIRHTGAISTAYAHLSRFGQDMKKGKRVRQGEVIGYVGSTGRSTGPHLHYEVIKGHAQVNPATVELPAAKPLAGKDLAAFKRLVEQRRREFEDARGHVLVASASRGPAATSCTGAAVC